MLLPRSNTSKFSEYGFIASITILPSKSSDDGSSCLFLQGIASSITSPNCTASQQTSNVHHSQQSRDKTSPRRARHVHNPVEENMLALEIWGAWVHGEPEMRSHTILGMVKLKSALTLRGTRSLAGSRHLQVTRSNHCLPYTTTLGQDAF